jgi:hypothetical protein
MISLSENRDEASFQNVECLSFYPDSSKIYPKKYSQKKCGYSFSFTLIHLPFLEGVSPLACSIFWRILCWLVFGLPTSL